MIEKLSIIMIIIITSQQKLNAHTYTRKYGHQINIMLNQVTIFKFLYRLKRLSLMARNKLNKTIDKSSLWLLLPVMLYTQPFYNNFATYYVINECT